VLRLRWVGTLQDHIRDQLAFGRRRFGPGSHCQRHGVLELKGTKSRVYAAIHTDQVWVYKSEQVSHSAPGDRAHQVSQLNSSVCSASGAASASR